MDTPAHVYLSPHLDDAVLSCGGRIWQQAQAGEHVLVVTIFGGAPAPDAPLSAFAQGLHARWGHPAAGERQEEDRAALALLRAESLHWPYTDCVYRETPDAGFLYDSEESLWERVHPAEESLVAELASRITVLPLQPGGTLFAPLGVRRHVDHQIVRRAAEACGRALAYYEDYPYAENPSWLQAVLATLDAEAELTSLSEEALAAKIAAIACYRSQISTFWASADEMATSVRAYAERLGQGKPAERYWKRKTR
jgi:LmbE family N-acetylglucosaminyl deacetylase